MMSTENRNACEALDEQVSRDQVENQSLTDKLKQAKQDNKEVRQALEKQDREVAALKKENRDFQQGFDTLDSELRKTRQVAKESSETAKIFEEELKSSYEENARLKYDLDYLQRTTESISSKAQRDLEAANDQRVAEVSRLKEKHEDKVTRLQREKEDIALAATKDLKMAKDKHVAEVSRLKEKHGNEVTGLKRENESITLAATKNLEMANNKHAAEVARLNTNHRKATDAITSKLKNDMNSMEQRMQAIIDEKTRAIAAVELHMASYNKQIHHVMSDEEVGHKFRDLILGIEGLLGVMPRPREYAVDATVDPSDFLGRNSSRGSRVWNKFLRKVCWDILLRGFFQRQPGFGSFGSQGDGYSTLLHLYRLFTKSNAKNLPDAKTSFPNNRTANSWRASLFEAILREVSSTTNDPHNLKETLEKVCQAETNPRSLGLMLKLCHDAGILSLEMGTQQSVIILETCHHGDWIRFGTGFKDDNHYNESNLQVDIMVQPSLKRIGDGSQDVVTEKVLAMGDIVSLKAGV
ncbi:hypothetical protein ONZ43_g2030 [Nemania bipapillata]|uniref:Uncharacterized protein n=1 Tax=Nemania bipapillata TaxID=110536 RepID=A0ACC2J289_9PEZI|nr:hypothetical protein ONZ43_g2030 [Nemania bipapillata]